MQDLKLGLSLGGWARNPTANEVELAQEAEALGFDSVWTSETYGSDALTRLAWIGAQTKRIRLGNNILQLSARAPTATAMAAMTLDHLSQGRFMLGLGVSGPQVIEGWYGAPFSKPIARTREYVSIIRQVLAREEPVVNPGPHYPLPYHGEGSWGLGKPLKPNIHPLRRDLPIFLAAEGPKNVALAAEICDGWLPLYYSPYRQEVYADYIAERKPGFEISPHVMVRVTDSIEEGLLSVKQVLSFYIGGMGTQQRNFHKELVCRMGFEAEANKIQELFLAGKREEALATVPDQLADEISLVGPFERIKDRLEAWRDTPVTTIVVQARSSKEVQTLAELVLN